VLSTYVALISTFFKQLINPAKTDVRPSRPTGPPPVTWQARALADAEQIEAGANSLAALLTPGDTLTRAQAIEAEAAALVTLLKAHQ